MSLSDKIKLNLFPHVKDKKPSDKCAHVQIGKGKKNKTASLIELSGTYNKTRQVLSTVILTGFKFFI